MTTLKYIIHDCVTIDGDRVVTVTDSKAIEYKKTMDSLVGFEIKSFPCLIKKSGITVLSFEA